MIPAKCEYDILYITIFDSSKNWENNGIQEIGSVTPILAVILAQDVLSNDESICLCYGRLMINCGDGVGIAVVSMK